MYDELIYDEIAEEFSEMNPGFALIPPAYVSSVNKKQSINE